jgi:hypothetical protein
VQLTSPFFRTILRRVAPSTWSPSRVLDGISLVLSLLIAAILIWDDAGRLRWVIGVTSDWDRHLSYLEGARAAVREYRELPFWNPYPCGGVPMLAHPESSILTPFYLLTLVLSPNEAIRWNIGLHHLIAVIGTWLLVREHLRRRGGTLLAAPLGACLFAAGSVFPLHLAEGHFEWLPAAYMPWILHYFEQSLRGNRLHHAVYAGIGIALMIGEGATYPTTHGMVLLGFYAGLIFLSERRWRPLIAAAIMVFSGLCLAAPKVLPMAEFLSRRPRHIGSTEEMPLEGLYHAFTSQLPRSAPWTVWGWHEFGHYVGMVGLGLALFGLLVGGRRARLLGAVAALFVVLGAGSFAPWAPWTLLHELPGFSSQHVPSRFLLGALLPFAVLASLGLAALLTPQPAIRRWLGSLVFISVLTTDIWVVRHDIFHPAPCEKRPGTPLPPTSKGFVTTVGTPDWADCHALASTSRSHVARIDAYEPLCPRADQGSYNGREDGLIPKSSPDYKGEAWLEPGAGNVRLLRHTNNRFVLKIDATRPTLLVLNQNGDTGWRVSDPACGRPFIDEHRRLALRVPAGTRKITVMYRPPYLSLGLGLCFATLAGLFVLRRQQRRGLG